MEIYKNTPEPEPLANISEGGQTRAGMPIVSESDRTDGDLTIKDMTGTPRGGNTTAEKRNRATEEANKKIEKEKQVLPKVLTGGVRAQERIGEPISSNITKEPRDFEVKDISKAKGRKKNPRTASAYAKDIKNIKELTNKLKSAKNNTETDKIIIKQMKERLNNYLVKLGGEYGDFINPETGNFSDQDYTKDFYSQLEIYSGLSNQELRNLFKSISTAQPKQISL